MNSVDKHLPLSMTARTWSGGGPPTACLCFVTHGHVSNQGGRGEADPKLTIPRDTSTRHVSI